MSILGLFCLLQQVALESLDTIRIEDLLKLQSTIALKGPVSDFEALLDPFSLLFSGRLTGVFAFCEKVNGEGHVSFFSECSLKVLFGGEDWVFGPLLRIMLFQQFPQQ